MKRFLIPLVLLLVVLILNSVYVVREIDQVIITQFGEPVGDPVMTPGLNSNCRSFRRFIVSINDSWNGMAIPTSCPPVTSVSFG